MATVTYEMNLVGIRNFAFGGSNILVTEPTRFCALNLRNYLIAAYVHR